MTMAAYLDKIQSYLAFYFAIDASQLALLLAASALSILVAFILTRKFAKPPLLWPLTSVAALSTLPIVVHFALLRQHSFYHDFTILKFAFPIVLLVLTLAPVAVAVFFAKTCERYLHFSPAIGEAICSILVCGAAISGIYFSLTRYDAPQRYFPPVRGGIGVLGTIIERNVEYDDVVFSPQIEIAHMSFEAGFSRKIVHRSLDIDRDLPNVMRDVCRPFNLVVVSDESDRPKRAAPPSEVQRDSGLVFYRWRQLQPVDPGCSGK
jgi:hypothetical protein